MSSAAGIDTRVLYHDLASTVQNGSRGAGTKLYRYMQLPALCIAIGACIFRDGLLLFAHRIPYGIDGYYYLIQIKSLIETGRLYFPTFTPLFFYIVAPLSSHWANPIVAVKVAALFIETGMLLGIYVFSVQLTGFRWRAIISTLIAGIAPSHLFFVLEFLKESLALTFLVWCAIATVRFCNTREWKYVALASSLGVASVLSHKSSFWVMIVSILALAIVTMAASRPNRAFVVLAAGWAVTALSVLAFPTYLVGAGHAAETLRNSVSWWTTEKLALLIGAPILYGASLSGPSKRTQASAVLAATALLVFYFTVNPFLSQNSDHFFGRVLLTSNVQLAIIAIGILYSIEAENASLSPLSSAAIVFTFLVVISLVGLPYAYSLRPGYLERREALAAKIEHLHLDDVHAEIIAPHGDEFLLTYASGIPAQQHWSPEPGQHLYWLLNLSSKDVKLGEELLRSETTFGAQILVNDDAFQVNWFHLPVSTRNLLLIENPELVKAGYTRGLRGR